MKKYLLMLPIMSLSACGYGNLDDVKSKAKETYSSNGHTVVGYEGYQIGSVVPFTQYGGAKVWYITESNGVRYNSYLKMWGDEVHIYNLRALDAIGTIR
jgi:hypothetical protein